MDPYALIPLFSCVLCTAYCLSVWTGPVSPEDRRRNAYTRGLMAIFAVFTGLAFAFRLGIGDPFDTIALQSSGVALIAIGPGAIATCFELALRPHIRLRRLSWLMYGIAVVLVAAQLTTGGIFLGITQTRFGIQPVQGPLFMPVVVFTIACGLLAYLTLSRALSDSPDFDATATPSRGLLRWSVFLLIGVASLTDVILPALGFETPHITPAGFGLIALTLMSTVSRRGGGHITATPALISEHILHALNEGVAFVDLHGRVLLANESLAHLIGEDHRVLVGRPLAVHLPDFDLDDPQDRLEVECGLQDLAGHSQPVSLSITTVRDERGAPLGRVVVMRDVREVKTLRSRLVMSGRLAAVGQMAAGIAHEINNPISFVRTNLGVLREHWHTLDEHIDGDARTKAVEDVLQDGEELIAESVEGVDRAASIVRDVRELSHAGPAGRVHTSLNPLLERVIRLASSEIGPGISIERRFGRRCTALVSPDQLTQVFVNLLTNALHAVEGQGHIVIESIRHGDRVEVSVIDDGVGVPESIRDRIFDPFYTTKEVGDGTGLGLSISHEIVRGHGGELVYAPNPEGGACFTVHLAASDEAAREASESDA